MQVDITQLRQDAVELMNEIGDAVQDEYLKNEPSSGPVTPQQTDVLIRAVCHVAVTLEEILRELHELREGQA